MSFSSAGSNDCRPTIDILWNIAYRYSNPDIVPCGWPSGLTFEVADFLLFVEQMPTWQQLLWLLICLGLSWGGRGYRLASPK